MAHDPEIAALNTAYEALCCVPPHEWTRTLNYLADRLAARDRAVHVGKLLERPEPTQFIHEGEMAIPYEDAASLVLDNAEAWVPFEVNGVTVVSQRFAVIVPIGNEEGDREGEEIEWFDTREAADAYVASMTETTA